MLRIPASPFFLCAVLSCAGTTAAASQGITFPDALANAEKSAPMLGARQSQTVAAQEWAAQASALPDPKLMVAIDNLPITGADRFDFHADDMTMKRVGLMQEFPARAKRRARQAVADRLVDETLAVTKTGQLSVRRATAEAWISLWAAERELGSLHVLREQSVLATSLAKARLAGGGGSAMDAMATQAEALELENRIEAAASSLEAERGTLARWLDSDPDHMATAGDPPDLQRLPNAASLLNSVDQQGPLLAWNSREAVADAQVALAVADKRPDWSLAASYGQRAGERSDMLTLEFSIDLPLFVATRQSHGIAARRAELEAVSALHEDARREQMDAVRRALAEWEGLKRQVRRIETELLPLAGDRTRTALASYRGGGALQAWLDARRAELELHAEHARQLGDLGQAWAALTYLLPANEGVQQ